MPTTREEFLARFPNIKPEVLESSYKRPNGLHQLQFKLPDEIYQALKRDATRQGRSMAGLVKHILAARYLRDEP